MSRGDIKCIYVKSTPAEKSRYPGKDAELVFDENGNYMAHEIEEIKKKWWTAQDSNL